MRTNRFKALEIPKDPTDYEDFEDIAPYNKLKDGKWTSLWMDRHPLYYKITNRFRYEYDGKLMWRELNAMKEEIENKRKSLRDYQKDILPRYAELSVNDALKNYKSIWMYAMESINVLKISSVMNVNLKKMEDVATTTK